MVRVVVGEGSCGLAAGAAEVYTALERVNRDLYELGVTGCVGMCFLEPIVDIYEDGALSVRLGCVTPDDAGRIASAIEEKDLSSLAKLALRPGEASFLAQQTRIALRHCGVTDPTSIDDYLARGGFEAAKKALTELTPEAVIDEIKTSGLAGRGGAGFPTWRKWSAARSAAGDRKYLICNADEGDPGAFMDRALLESDPFNIIEGMLIGAYAVGASEMLVYVRAEYPLAVSRLKNAVEQAAAHGFTGKNILGTDFSCDFTVRTGAGAFVCGEETALIASLEGERGAPRPKPPYPAQRGYRGAPTVINNVETLANVAWILEKGGAEFAKIGTEHSKGTKVFALAGKILRGGLAEVPMGTTLRELIFDIGGGMRKGAEFKSVQLGGPSGGCLPESLLDTPVDYEAMAATGAIMGSGGLVVMDTRACMVEMARYFLHFITDESCGQCVSCRVGTKRVFEILTRLVEGEGREGDIELLEELCREIQEGSLCGLGQTAMNPVLTTIKYFRSEYEEHIREKNCPAVQCVALRTYYIIPKLCRNCRICLKSCPVDCIIYDNATKKYIIDQPACIKCDACPPFCPFDAIIITHGGEPHA